MTSFILLGMNLAEESRPMIVVGWWPVGSSREVREDVS